MVVGGLLGLDKYFFKREEVIADTGNEDADNFTDFKLYRYSRNVANIPEDSDGIIAVFIYNTSAIPKGVVNQLAFTQNNNLYIRTRWYTGAWKGWTRLT